MKKIIIVATLALAISGCASDGGQLASMVLKAALPNNATHASKVPDQVYKMMMFSSRETTALNACIVAQQKAGFKPIGQRKELTLIETTSSGNRSHKVTVAGVAAFQVPVDALAKQSSELKKMLSTFGAYVAGRHDRSTIVVTATKKSDVTFLRETIQASAPGVEISTIVKPGETPLISFVSSGPTVRILL